MVTLGHRHQRRDAATTSKRSRHRQGELALTRQDSLEKRSPRQCDRQLVNTVLKLVERLCRVPGREQDVLDALFARAPRDLDQSRRMRVDPDRQGARFMLRPPKRRQAVTRSQVNRRTLILAYDLGKLADVDVGQFATQHPAHNDVIITPVVFLPGVFVGGV